MTAPILALQWTYVGIGTAIVVILMGLYLVPYLIKENVDGKKELGRVKKINPDGRVSYGPETTPGVGDNTPGRVGNPAPGQPDGQADPYSPSAQRKGTPVRS